MLKARTLALLLVSFWCIAPAQSQALMEGTFVRSLGAGAGAGAAASMGHGKVVRRTAESMLQAQQAMIAQTKTIEQYVANGIQLTAKKQWATAEQYFQEALKVIAKRDGPGSPKSVPVLAHLADVSKKQHKLDDAIGYQKTVVAFANAGKAQNPAAAVQAQVDLSNLYIDKGDLTNAEGVLKQSADIVRSNPSIPPKTYSATLKVYGTVLRKLNREAEAETIDQELAAKGEGSGTPTASTPTEPAQNTATTMAPQTVPGDASASTPTTTPATAVAPSTTATVGATSTATDTSATNAALDLMTPAASTHPDETPAASAPTTAPAAPAAATASASAAAPADASASQPPPRGTLPPPTAEWPVMNSDGKIVSEQSAAPADTPPETSPPAGETKSAPAATQPAGETGAAPAASATSQPAESAAEVAPPSAAASPTQPAEIK